MDNKILYTAKFTHDLKFHKVWWKSDKRCGSWSGRTHRQTDRFLYTPQTMFAGGIKIVETEAKSISLAHNVHDRLLYWLGTGTSIKSGGVKLSIWL